MPTIHRLRTIAPAVAGVVAATALLSGCLGSDKSDKSSKAPSSSATASTNASATEKATTSPTGKPTGKATGLPKPTGSASGSADVIDAFTYKTGQCINQNGTKTDDVPCSKSHNGQVGRAFDLPSTVTPETPGYEDKVSELCEQYVGPIVDRQPASPKITFSFTYPLDMESWRHGNHQAACIIEREDKLPLTTIIK
ncbi:septum formation family protein [Embleya sp. NPDC055664]|uniref:septum formation family protein n=1 Tax=Embleya sp. NPDC059237 TaxID=3346784 RepID=UPI0036C5E04B